MVNNLVVSLFRHGLTLENERKAYIGWTNSPLSENGKNKLERICYANVAADIVFSSPLQRCVETASIIFPERHIITVDELKEMHFGAWEGKTYDELQDRASYRKWLTNIFTQPIEAGETFTDFTERIEAGLQKVMERVECEKVNRIAIVTHGGVIRYILHSLFPHEKSFFDWDIPFGGGYELTWHKDRLGEVEKQCSLLAVEPTTVRQIG